jgi:hypothetical protein
LRGSFWQASNRSKCAQHYPRGSIVPRQRELFGKGGEKVYSLKIR